MVQVDALLDAQVIEVIDDVMVSHHLIFFKVVIVNLVIVIRLINLSWLKLMLVLDLLGVLILLLDDHTSVHFHKVILRELCWVA